VTKTKRQGFEQGEVSVIRRYSDFLWLSEDLTRLHPGIIIPCLPEKQTVGRFSPEFVEARRRSLEKFLLRISEHPTLGFSTSFIKFLQAGDAQFLEAKEITKASKTKVTDKAKSWFQGATNSLMASAGGTSKKPEPEKTTAELKIDEIAVYLTTLQKRLDSLHKNACNLVKKSGESANSVFELSQGLSALGQTEGEAIGNALNQVSRVMM